MRRWKELAGVTGALLASWPVTHGAGQPTSVVDSPHNLSAAGSGPVRATIEDQVCIFCHTPHNAAPIRPLWNRETPMDAYTIYASRSLDARPGQPTGTSKMCLSCHDGTIALGSVLSRGTPILFSGGVSTIPQGAGRIGTDLADDHPISFHYDSSLVSRDSKVKEPGLLPPEVRLDANSELQCTTCHDAHNNSLGKFLTMRNDNSALCTACHQMGQTTITAHQSCASCHQPHSAPSGPYLLRRQTITETCVSCHNGTAAGAANIAPDLNKSFAHDTESPVDPPGEAWENVSCADCHEPHTMMTGPGFAPGAHPNFGRVAGVNSSGAPVAGASFEFEVCFKCHAENGNHAPWVDRQIVQTNTRLEFSTGAVSFHPVAGPGRNTEVPSLRPGLTTATVIYCSDCHASDSGPAGGGSGAGGTHGSVHGPLLAMRYETGDHTSESTQAYALCYKCHDRANILDNRSFKEHKKHIVEERTPCSACHDAHGIASSQGSAMTNSNLINFDTTIVFPDPVTGRREFRDSGLFRGECFLSCHGRNHSPERY